jgi:diguanylate cyclase (GGDEF)-like protein
VSAWLPRLVLLAIVPLAGLGAAGALLGHAAGVRLQERILAKEEEQNAANRLRLAILSAESAFAAHLLHDRSGPADPMHQALGRIESPPARALLEVMDQEDAEIGARAAAEAFVAARRQGAALADASREATLLHESQQVAQRAAETLGAGIERFVDARRATIAALTARLAAMQRLVLGLVAGSALLSGLCLVVAWIMLKRQERETKSAEATLSRRSEELGALLRMNELLQACQTRADVEQVAGQAAAQLLPGVAGVLYVFSADGDRLDHAVQWGSPEAPRHIDPGACWALKRGRAHVCGAETVPCVGSGCVGNALCLPMAARGEAYGVLRFAIPEGFDHTHDRRVADAMADGVSMALANLQLRERLRTEALRDPLTGLYNRRFLEESAPTLLRQAERRGSTTCVAILDLDHFKRVNDGHGHSVGDAVLRAVGNAIIATLRGSDVCCRHGGEEFVMLLPDCDLGGGFERMDELRRGIGAMRHGGLPPVTASIGLALVPHGAPTLEETVRLADEALYTAKQGGRDRVVTSAMVARLKAMAGSTAPDRPGE